MNYWLQVIGLCILGYVVLIRVLKGLKNVYFPTVLKFIMKKIHSQLREVKPKLFKEAFENVKTDNKSGKLEILELGIGTGENFKCFPLNSNITILDKTDIFLSYLQESIDRCRSDLSISKLVVNSAEKMSSIESNSMDVVVHTFILCSIPDTDSTMKEIYRVLKPGGVCVFMEHSVENRNKLRVLGQKLIEPLLGDCSFKDMNKLVQSGPYDRLVIKNSEFLNGFFNMMNPIVFGYGIKQLN